ncbi:MULTISPECIES: tryptophan synthase subunit beta like protein [Vreelandella]|uniref:Tryptophan synthase subunit beta like protein n=2 Tax=Vreelandella TaxID=3137766 RepID=A0A7C9P3A4_9GAMM|nr:MULTISPECIES: tryptophan synthase subunit beta like protein [Halomonas]NDL70470.1 tryptophan synthase subunit beta like protein [Halomonas alkaliphila]NYS43322.1 tryptophan synthase subunit beta like protein [Halomonas zhaodongensis]
MFYIKRNAQGEIVMLSKEPSPECNDTINEDSPEVFAFLAEQTGQSAQFIASDLAFVRVVEDMLEVLLEKGVISFTDLPSAAQSKIMERKSLRSKSSVNLLSDDGDIF